MKHPADLTATEAADWLKRGQLTASALMEACIDRIASAEPKLHSFVYFEAAEAMRRAEEADRKRSPRGALHGLPLGVKDILDTHDMTTSYGSPIWDGYRPRADAVSVALARRAGAIVLGKTATTEFATRKPSATSNPSNVLHTPGGSSSGSAAAVAARLCPFALATQTAGSIIRPAAYCGVVGFKPSFGLIHRAGMKVMSESLDTIGIIARSIADCGFYIEAVSGRSMATPQYVTGRAPRFGLVMGPSRSATQATVKAIQEAIETLRRKGATVDEIILPDDVEAAYHAHPIVMNMEIAEALSFEVNTTRDMLSDTLIEVIDWALEQPPKRLDDGRECFVRARAAFNHAVDGFDAIITPSTPGEAPASLENTGDPAFNILWSALHTPCVTIPIGQGELGLPLGLQIVCRQGEDSATLGWAKWIEARIA